MLWKKNVREQKKRWKKDSNVNISVFTAFEKKKRIMKNRRLTLSVQCSHRQTDRTTHSSLFSLFLGGVCLGQFQCLLFSDRGPTCPSFPPHTQNFTVPGSLLSPCESMSPGHFSSACLNIFVCMWMSVCALCLMWRPSTLKFFFSHRCEFTLFHSIVSVP